MSTVLMPYALGQSREVDVSLVDRLLAACAPASRPVARLSAPSPPTTNKPAQRLLHSVFPPVDVTGSHGGITFATPGREAYRRLDLSSVFITLVQPRSRT